MLKIKLLLVLLFFFVLMSYSQVEYENGYFIDINNKKTECLIKNSAWKNNPAEFTYKLSENGSTLVATVSDIIEFGIENSMKYVGVDVQIDRTGNELSQLTYNRNPEYVNERLFLKVLIEGKATLLIFNDANLQRFFLQKENSTRQLVYKKYLGENRESRTNNAFRQQLLMDVNCGETNENSVKEVDYKTSELVNYFQKFNECEDGKYKDYTAQKTKGAFQLKITPGIHYASLLIKDSYNTPAKDIPFDSKMNFRLGVEMEYILPYNKNKWGFMVEPSYQSYSSSIKYGTSTYSVDYNSFEIAIGIRYRMFVSKHSCIFLNGLIGPSFPVNSKIELAESYDVSPAASLNLGVGYSVRKINVEFRYYKNRDLMDDYLYWGGVYDRLSLIVGYKLL